MALNTADGTHETVGNVMHTERQHALSGRFCEKRRTQSLKGQNPSPRTAYAGASISANHRRLPPEIEIAKSRLAPQPALSGSNAECR
jgi:hypothetical protein